MLKRWAAWPPGIRWLAGIAALVLAAAIVWALFVPLADWLARHDVGPAKPALLQTARDAARGRLLTLAAGLFAAGALVFTALNFTLSRRTFELTEQGQVTDRYTKAIEQLGDGKLDVRIGGIYALERVARDSARDHPVVIEVLTAFIREHSREQWPLPKHEIDPAPPRETRPDVQAAITVVGRRSAKHDLQPMNLTGANLTGADLTGVTTHRPTITRTDPSSGAINVVTYTDVTGANLTHADLTDAILTGADLTAANLESAKLASADLTGANLESALLILAVLTGADLTAANLRRAVLARANLTGAVLTGADLTNADLTGASLTDARLSDADLTMATWPKDAPVPEGWMVDSTPGPFSGCLKRAGQLSEVIAHYL
jgi:hypothetical protein